MRPKKGEYGKLTTEDFRALFLLRYIHWYNTGRPHSSLDDATPEAAYLNGLSKVAEAA